MVRNVGRSGQEIDLRKKVLRPEEAESIYTLIKSINERGRNNGKNGEVQKPKRMAGSEA